jgi:hypothetical protein
VKFGPGRPRRAGTGKDAVGSIGDVMVVSERSDPSFISTQLSYLFFDSYLRFARVSDVDRIHARFHRAWSFLAHFLPSHVSFSCMVHFDVNFLEGLRLGRIRLVFLKM